MLTIVRIAFVSFIDVVWALLRFSGAGSLGGERVQDALNRVFAGCEDAGLIPRLPAFDAEHADYPALHHFEERYPAMRAECESLLAERARLLDIERLGGSYTAGGHRRIGWKVFVLRAGRAVPEHCARCPVTASAIAAVPGVVNAFFSILEPRQYIAAHWGYYKGFVRYHLGVVIPRDNADRSCWLRVNADPHDNALRDAQRIAAGHKYFWHNGRGVVFDDTVLHDACNASDEVRAVLFVDVMRKLPWPLAWFNHLAVAIAYRFEPALRNMARNAVVRVPESDAPVPNLRAPPC